MREQRLGRKFTRRQFLYTTAGAGLFFLGGCGGDTGGSATSGEATTSGEAASFPEQPIRIVVPYAAGGSTDQTARAMADIVKFDQSVSVENREGGNGVIGTSELADSAPNGNGYTLLMVSNGAFATEPVLRGGVPFSLDDFVGITGVLQEPPVLAVRADSPWETIDDLAEGTELNEPLRTGQSGAGSWLRLAHGGLYNELGIETNNVPFGGGAPAVTALLGNEIQSVVAAPGELGQYLESGEVRALGVFTEERTNVLPEVPTFVEQGYDFSVNVWQFLLAVAGTPDQTVEILRNKFRAVFETERYQQFVEDNQYPTREVPGDEVINELRQDRQQAEELAESLNVEASQ